MTVAGGQQAASRASAPVPQVQGLDDLLRSMADDEFVIGFSDSEWTGIAPQLEEDIAMSSLAQDELGHAQALYGLLAEVTGTAPTPTRSPTTASRPTTATPASSTTAAATGR